MPAGAVTPLDPITSSSVTLPGSGRSGAVQRSWTAAVGAGQLSLCDIPASFMLWLRGTVCGLVYPGITKIEISRKRAIIKGGK
jgi:hypothetical protein